MTESQAGMPRHHLCTLESELPDFVQHAGQESDLPHLLTQTEQVTAVDRQQKLPQPWTFVGRSACQARRPRMLSSRHAHLLAGMAAAALPAALWGPAGLTSSLAAAAHPVTQDVVLTCWAK